MDTTKFDLRKMQTDLSIYTSNSAYFATVGSLTNLHMQFRRNRLIMMHPGTDESSRFCSFLKPKYSFLYKRILFLYLGYKPTSNRSPHMQKCKFVQTMRLDTTEEVPQGVHYYNLTFWGYCRITSKKETLLETPADQKLLIIPDRTILDTNLQ